MRVLSVKFKKGLVLFKFIGQHPSKLFVRTFVSFPANIVEQGALATPSIDLRIEYLANVIILFAVNNDWRRWILALVRDMSGPIPFSLLPNIRLSHISPPHYYSEP